MPFKKWNIAKADPAVVRTLTEECGVSELVASILAGRGYTSGEEAARFLGSGAELSSPFEIRDMEQAADRVRRAIDESEKITIYGDYDCDGVTATAMLYSYLSSVGAEVEYYIPQREGEGYGLNRDAVREIAENGTRLLVTVDNGISAIEEAKYVRELGMELVITDHHQPGGLLPVAEAVVDPHRKDDSCGCKDLAGVGVAFKLIAALEDGDCRTALEYFADIAAVGTIGDIVPLLGENRVLVSAGLRALSMTDNFGLLALMEVSGVKPETVTAQNVAFSLVPRINAAGRMGSADLAVHLLLAETPEEAQECAAEMDARNKERQQKEQEITADVEAMISTDRSLLDGRLLVLKNEKWHPGIIGIVCSRLMERYGKPVLLMTGEELLTGSGRSLGDFHLFEALSANAHHLVKFGGHKLAAGFSLKAENFEAFRQGMEEYALLHFDLMPRYTLNLDKVLLPGDLTVDQMDSLSVLEPFGAQNETPLFLLKGAVLESVTPLSGNRHLKLGLKYGGMSVPALCFGMSPDRFFYRPGQIVDLAVNADVNEYNGRRSVSLKMRDIRPGNFAQDKFFNAKGYYEKLRRNEPVLPAIAARSLPAREETIRVYRFLQSRKGYAGDLDCLYAELMTADINYCKLRILLDILQEAGLIEISPLQNGVCLLPPGEKADLDQTPTMVRIRAASRVRKE